MIKASCKICGFEKEFEDKFAGKTFKCPSCTTPVKIEQNELFEQPKKEIEQTFKNDNTSTNNKIEANFINNKFYKFLGIFGFIIFSLLIYNSYNQRSKDNSLITVIDTVVETNIVNPKDYWKSKKVENPENSQIQIKEDKDLNNKRCGEFDINIYNQAKSNFIEGYTYSYYFKTAWEFLKEEGEQSYNAVLYFEEAIKLNPENGGIFSDLGNCYRGGFKCYKKAEDLYNEAIEKGFQKGFVYYNRAICRYENGDLDGMREDLQMAKEYGWSSDNYNLINK